MPNVNDKKKPSWSYRLGTEQNPISVSLGYAERGTNGILYVFDGDKNNIAPFTKDGKRMMIGQKKDKAGRSIMVELESAFILTRANGSKFALPKVSGEDTLEMALLSAYQLHLIMRDRESKQNPKNKKERN